MDALLESNLKCTDPKAWEVEGHGPEELLLARDEASEELIAKFRELMTKTRALDSDFKLNNEKSQDEGISSTSDGLVEVEEVEELLLRPVYDPFCQQKACQHLIAKCGTASESAPRVAHRKALDEITIMVEEMPGAFGIE